MSLNSFSVVAASSKQRRELAARMASACRLAVGTLMSELDEFVFTNAESIEFFQLVRLLHQLYPDRKGVGEYSARLDQEVARFACAVDAGVSGGRSRPARSADRRHPRSNARQLHGARWTRKASFPYEYTLLVDDRARHRDTGLRDFLDIFHHRIVSIFYRAWEKTHFFAALERGKPDRLSEHVADLAGIGAPEVQANAATRHRVAAVLRRTAGAAPAVRGGARATHRATTSTSTQPWYSSPAAGTTLTRAPSARWARSAASPINSGSAPWSAMRSTIPRPAFAFASDHSRANATRIFFPGAAARQTLRDVVRFFAGDHLDVELQLVLKADDVPACRLGADHETPLALGWYTWLHTSSQMSRDPDDTVLSL